jgi:D-alanyl-D-alanine carboxypeptidase/D-alanyl-D-alanine-endopeptidase (penicillin-binding protein 4)
MRRYHRAMARARRIACCLLIAFIAIAVPANVAWARPDATPVATQPAWMRDITTVIGNRPVSVAIGRDGDSWFGHLGWVGRPPASNEKLLLSMALLQRYRPWRTIHTNASATALPGPRGVIRGNLWIVGHGDPGIDGTRIAALARAIRDAGVRRIRGSVLGNTGPFARDWWARGWKDYFPADYIPLPTALTYRENTDRRGVHVSDPELRAATKLTARLELLGIPVGHKPGMGHPPARLLPIAQIASPPLRDLIRRMDLKSRNFWAEVLGKYLGADEWGRGTIANGARAIDRFTDMHGQDFRVYDSSGLSYANRATARGILELLWDADGASWGPILRASLPAGGKGTLKDRLTDIRIRAKTGTLDDASALSGWVWLERTGGWVEFSILSSGFNEWTAKKIEDRIVRIVSYRASPPP